MIKDIVDEIQKIKDIIDGFNYFDKNPSGFKYKPYGIDTTKKAQFEEYLEYLNDKLLDSFIDIHNRDFEKVFDDN